MDKGLSCMILDKFTEMRDGKSKMLGGISRQPLLLEYVKKHKGFV